MRQLALFTTGRSRTLTSAPNGILAAQFSSKANRAGEIDSKHQAKVAARRLDIPVLPAYTGPKNNLDFSKMAEKIGYPLSVKDPEKDGVESKQIVRNKEELLLAINSREKAHRIVLEAVLGENTKYTSIQLCRDEKGEAVIISKGNPRHSLKNERSSIFAEIIFGPPLKDEEVSCELDQAITTVLEKDALKLVAELKSTGVVTVKFIVQNLPIVVKRQPLSHEDMHPVLLEKQIFVIQNGEHGGDYALTFFDPSNARYIEWPIKRKYHHLLDRISHNEKIQDLDLKNYFRYICMKNGGVFMHHYLYDLSRQLQMGERLSALCGLGITSLLPWQILISHDGQLITDCLKKEFIALGEKPRGTPQEMVDELANRSQNKSALQLNFEAIIGEKDVLSVKKGISPSDAVVTPLVKHGEIIRSWHNNPYLQLASIQIFAKKHSEVFEKARSVLDELTPPTCNYVISPQEPDQTNMGIFPLSRHNRRELRNVLTLFWQPPSRSHCEERRQRHCERERSNPVRTLI